jgi:hypothetical protein
MRSPEFSIPQQESELKQEKVLHFDNVKITPEKPFEFDVHVKKEPITIKDGDRVTGNGIEVRHRGQLLELMTEAHALQELSELERIHKLVDLVHSKLTYPYPETIAQEQVQNPKKGKWLDEVFAKGGWATQDVTSFLENGYGDCKVMVTTFLVLAQEAGLEGIACSDKNHSGALKNLIRPDTGKPIFKMGEIEQDVTFSHAWTEIQLSDGSWIPIDPTTRLIGDTPEMLNFIKAANYNGGVGVNLNGLPNGLVGSVNGYFEAGAPETELKGSASINTLRDFVNKTSRPALDNFNGDLDVTFDTDSSDRKIVNLEIL